MSSSQNTHCIREASSTSPNVPEETLHRFFSDIQDTMVGSRNLPNDPLELLMAVLDEAMEIIGNEGDTRLTDCSHHRRVGPGTRW
jgi:hypothetical protein